MLRGCCFHLQEGERVVMVQEYADGGDLFNLLQKYGGCLSERVAVQMVLDPFLRVLQVGGQGCREPWWWHKGSQTHALSSSNTNRGCSASSEPTGRVPCSAACAVPAHARDHPPRHQAGEHPVCQQRLLPQAGRLWPGHLQQGGARRHTRRVSEEGWCVLASVCLCTGVQEARLQNMMGVKQGGQHCITTDITSSTLL